MTELNAQRRLYAVCLGDWRQDGAGGYPLTQMGLSQAEQASATLRDEFQGVPFRVLSGRRVAAAKQTAQIIAGYKGDLTHEDLEVFDHDRHGFLWLSGGFLRGLVDVMDEVNRYWPKMVQEQREALVLVMHRGDVRKLLLGSNQEAEIDPLQVTLGSVWQILPQVRELPAERAAA